MVERRIFSEKAVDCECGRDRTSAVIAFENSGEGITCEVEDKAVLVVHCLDKRIEYRVHKDRKGFRAVTAPRHELSCHVCKTRYVHEHDRSVHRSGFFVRIDLKITQLL